MSDCDPEICGKLTPRQDRMHLLYLDRLPIWKCYRDTAKKGSKPTQRTCEVEGSEILRKPEFQAALQHHRDLESERYSKTKERQIERLVSQAEGSDPRHFASMDGDGSVTFKDWADVPGELTRGVASLSEIEGKDGTITRKMTFRDPAAAERLLADLGGWKEPERVTVDFEGLSAAAAAGDEAAEAKLKEIAGRLKP